MGRTPENRARIKPKTYVVEAVAKALDILEAFGNPEGLKLNEIRAKTGLSKSSTFRLVYTLAERGYIVRSADSSHYGLGVKLLERAANVHRNVREVARPNMLELQRRFNETVNLGVLDEAGNVLYVDITESSRPFRMTATVGCRIPAHLTAMGKTILANMQIGNHTSRSRGIVPKLSPPALHRLYCELEWIRRRGYAINTEENEPGIGSIASAILAAQGRPVAAISICGPAHRILPKEKAIAEAVMGACGDVSMRLGFIAD